MFHCLLSYAQQLPIDDQGNINFTEVVSTENELTADQIYDNVKLWVSTKSSNFNRSNSEKNAQGAAIYLGTGATSEMTQVDKLFINEDPLKLSDKNEHIIIGRVVNKYTGTQLGCLRIAFFEYDIIVRAKDGRYKYDVTNFTYTHYNQKTAQQAQIYGWTDDGPCKSKGDLKELLECNKCEKQLSALYQYLIDDTQALITDLKSAVNQTAIDDDW